MWKFGLVAAAVAVTLAPAVAPAQERATVCLGNWNMGPVEQGQGLRDLQRNTLHSVAHCTPGQVLYWSPPGTTEVYFPAGAMSMLCDYGRAIHVEAPQRFDKGTLSCVLAQVRSFEQAPSSPPPPSATAPPNASTPRDPTLEMLLNPPARGRR
jgi:hypothetical protein